MMRSRLKIGIVRSLGLAIACSAVTAAISLPAQAQDDRGNTVNNSNTNSRYQNRPSAPSNLSQQNTQPTQNPQLDDTQSAISAEELERQSVQQNRWLQDLEWRRQFGDLDSTPVGR